MQQPYREEVAQATAVLVNAFSLCIDEIFKKPLVIAKDNTNPFSELPQHVQMAVIQSAFTKGLAQCLAALAMMADNPEGDKRAISMGTVVLKHEYKQYLETIRRAREQQDSVGEGSEAGHDCEGHVPCTQHQGGQDPQG